jgi:hypothetical protein
LLACVQEKEKSTKREKRTKGKERKDKGIVFDDVTRWGGFMIGQHLYPGGFFLFQAQPLVQVQIHFGIGGVLAARGIYLALAACYGMPVRWTGR